MVSARFCPKCGKKGITGEFCRQCSAEMMADMIRYKEISIKVCHSCRSYFSDNKWVPFIELDDVVRKIAKKNIKKRGDFVIKPMLPHTQYKPGLSYDAEVEISFSKREKYYLPVKIEITQCPKCSRMGTQYFEGIFQLRNPSQEAIDFIKDEAKRQKEKGIFITKEENVQNGIDFYVTSQHYIQTLGQKMLKVFGGILKINPRIFTIDRQTSKDVYRVNVLFEMLDFKRGDILNVNGKVIRVSEIGKKGIGWEVAVNKKTSFDYKRQDYKILKKMKTAVTKVYPRVEVLDPETYQSMPVENIKVCDEGGRERKLSVDEKVQIVADGGRFYIV